MDGPDTLLAHEHCLSGGQIAVTAWWCDSGSHSQYSFSKSIEQHRNTTVTQYKEASRTS